MSAQWYAIYTLLLTQMVICIVVVLPLPLSFRNKLLSGIYWVGMKGEKGCVEVNWEHQVTHIIQLGVASVWNQPKVNMVIKTVFGLLLVLFIDTLRTASNLDTQIHDRTQDVHTLCDLRMRKFREERNSYIVGFWYVPKQHKIYWSSKVPL